MFKQEQFAIHIDADNPDYKNFDDEDTEINIGNINPFISCILCKGSYVYIKLFKNKLKAELS